MGLPIGLTTIVIGAPLPNGQDAEADARIWWKGWSRIPCQWAADLISRVSPEQANNQPGNYCTKYMRASGRAPDERWGYSP